ncbi:MAG: CoA-binding protein [Alphaproteobacteria bacterium]|jgi:predicted CoA-binding protein|nr:CoA-binding protein [Alphaproteobacteria bacterium]MBU0833453.1 CoA-binding protein [Alphaproteobacteria bacterium]MBU1764615.1 CoA-binding protein [Alphaproteobacteria bacterium]
MADHDHYSADDLRDILGSVRTIALLGASPKPDRPSFGVMRFLLSKGYTVYPVNPGQAGKEILGQTVYATMADIAEPIDMVDVFRAPEYLGEVVTETLALQNRPKVIWGQLTVRDDEAVKPAEAAGIRVVMDRCPAIEIPRLGL